MANPDPTSQPPTDDSGSATEAFPPLGEQQTLPPQPTSLGGAATIGPIAASDSAPTGHQKVKGYEILGELGRGGMGVVYKARQIGLNRVVALKMILGGAHTEPAVLARFQAEALAVAKLQHPNIVQIYETGQHDELPYLSLEYVDGGSLDRRLEGRPLPPREAAELVKTLARAVDVAHQAGIIHRDLKPANVLLTSSGVPKITDFGLAKTLGEDRGQTASGAILGTPSYMAPEQAGGKKHEITRAVDVYALGAILYELLTGRPPFRADTPLGTLLLVVGEEATPPREVCPAVPRELEAICLKCLQKKPAGRYATAEALADDLQKFLNGEPVSALSATVSEQAWRRLRKRPLIGTVIVLTAGVALFSALALTYLEPSVLLVSGWTLWIACAAALYFLLPDHRGLALIGFCSLLLAHMGWQSTMAAHPPGGLPYQLSMIWIISTTVLYFLLPRRSSGIVFAGFCSLAFGWVFIGMEWQREEVQFLLHPIGVAACCMVARLLARAVGGDAVTAVFAGFSTGMLTYWGCLKELYPGPEPGNPGISVSKIESASLASALVSVAVGACAAFILTSPTIRRWSICAVQRIVRPVTAVRLRVWLGIPATIVTACLLLLVGRGVWLWATNRELLTLKCDTGPVYSVAFSPDGGRLATGAVRRNWKPGWKPGEKRADILSIWDVKTGKTVQSYRLKDAGAVYGVAFSPDGGRLAVAMVRQDAPVMLISGTADPQMLFLKGLAEPARSLAFSADGKYLAAGGDDGAVKVWDTATANEILTLPRQETSVTSVAFSPDGTQLATYALNATIKLWDARTGQEMKTLRNGTGNDRILNFLFNAVFSPDGKRLAAGGWGKTVRVWDVETGQEVLSLVGHTDYVQGIAFSPDGKWIASASNDQTVRVWDAANGKEWLTLTGHTSFVYGVAFSRDSKRLASASEDGTVKVWRKAD
jgi:DNA-binding beta-propeller fold protein YncE